MRRPDLSLGLFLLKSHTLLDVYGCSGILDASAGKGQTVGRYFVMIRVFALFPYEHDVLESIPIQILRRDMIKAKKDEWLLAPFSCALVKKKESFLARLSSTILLDNPIITIDGAKIGDIFDQAA